MARTFWLNQPTDRVTLNFTVPSVKKWDDGTFISVMDEPAEFNQLNVLRGVVCSEGGLVMDNTTTEIDIATGDIKIDKKAYQKRYEEKIANGETTTMLNISSLPSGTNIFAGPEGFRISFVDVVDSEGI